MRIVMFVLFLVFVAAGIFCLIRIEQLDKKRDELLLQIIDDTFALRKSYERNGIKMPIDSIVEAVQTAMNGSFEEGQEP